MTDPVALPRNRSSISRVRSPAQDTDGAMLERGATGDRVRDLQQQLVDRGYRVAVDGVFGPRTESAVRSFQRDHGARVDGIVGPETTGKLRVTAPARNGSTDGVDRGDAARREGPAAAPTVEDRTRSPSGTVRAGDLARADDARIRGSSTPGGRQVTLAPANATEREKWDHYAAIVRANGGEVCPNGQPTVLGIRGLSREHGQHDTTSSRRYDDTFVVLTPDGRVRELPGATHPGQTRSSLSPDVNGDGVGDVGMIRPGNYRAVPNGPHRGAASFHVQTLGGSGRIPGYRDTNHDGSFSDAERRASERRGDTQTEILFHQGNPSSPSSIGCLTMSPSVYANFLRTIGNRGFTFSLVDANSR